MQYQLELFIRHMNDDSQYDNAINCGNAYWQHPIEDGQKDRRPREMTRRQERVICRLMTQAIYFANAWSEAVRENAKENKGQDEEIKGLMRCTIVDVYKDILWIYGCEGWWGTYYAWYTTQIMRSALESRLGKQNCNKGKYKDIELHTWDMRNKMKTWLKENKQMQEQLAQEQIGDDCKGAQVKLEVGPREQEQQKDKDNQTKDEVKQKVTKILQEVEEEMKNEEKQLRGSTARAPKYPAVDDEDEKKDEEIEGVMNQAIGHVKVALDAQIKKNADAQAAVASGAENRPSTAPTAPKKGTKQEVSTTGNTKDNKEQNKADQKNKGETSPAAPAPASPGVACNRARPDI
ncbi:hypothetical protein AK88_02983 [Plasmodium fragile]|uniref:Schizont-infected cell agglutination extracellular alpha domain-containing protein n=1 Tax=Plasmodium fragile TaxID=5857 RepID=A0A0D9QK19_PLAFR|nr:uncharacterized protein AK88_02983 [Plasmodium fragile]KJP87303.1 hypothetical protein AK88_02983 [Plasmodium fragile]